MITLEMISAEFKRFLAGDTTLQDFEGWLASESLDMHLQHVSEEVQQVVWSLKLNFAEYTSGHLDRRELIAEARNMLSFPPHGSSETLHSKKTENFFPERT